MDVSLEGHFTASVDIANWDTLMTFPDQSPEYNPHNLADPSAQTNPYEPKIDWSVKANGQITAHVKPKLSFGITWGSAFQVGDCSVDLVADGSVTAYIKAEASNNGAKLCYGVTAQASLQVELNAPSQFNWVLSRNPWPLNSWGPVDVLPERCPIQSRRDLEAHANTTKWALDAGRSAKLRTPASHALERRGTRVLGPLLRLPFGLTCPTAGDDASAGDLPSCPMCGPESSESAADLTFLKDRGLVERGPDEGTVCYVYDSGGEKVCNAGIGANSGAVLQRFGSNTTSVLEKRTNKQYVWNLHGVNYLLSVGDYPSCTEASVYYGAGIKKWFGFDASVCLPIVSQRTTAQITANGETTANYVSKSLLSHDTCLGPPSSCCYSEHGTDVTVSRSRARL
jgi:chitinase